MSLTVMLADTGDLLKQVLELTFSERNIGLESVGTGTDAMLRIKEVTPDVLLADVGLQGVDGYGLCEIVKKDSELKNTKVILINDSFTKFDEEKAQEVGYDGHLSKPFNEEDLYELLETLGVDVPAKPDDEPTVLEEAEPIIDEDELPANVIEMDVPDSDLSEDIFDQTEARQDDEIFDTEEPADDADTNQFEVEPSPFVEEEEGSDLEIEGGEEEADMVDPFGVKEDAGDKDEWIEAEGKEPSPPEEEVPLTEEETEIKPMEETAQPEPAGVALDSQEAEEIVEKIVQRISDQVIREIAWEVVPQVAEKIVRETLDKLTEKK